MSSTFKRGEFQTVCQRLQERNNPDEFYLAAGGSVFGLVLGAAGLRMSATNLPAT
jgi:hypothetical protein